MESFHKIEQRNPHIDTHQNIDILRAQRTNLFVM